MADQEEEKTKTGGPAFPMVAETWYAEGMTLRDWFAGLAMQAALAREAPADTYKVVAEEAYRQADAMVVARRD